MKWRNTVSRYLKLIRQAIAQYRERESPFSGGVEMGGSYFGARTVRGKLGCESRGKTSPSTFYLHLKEYELRFNYQDVDLYRLLLKITRLC